MCGLNPIRSRFLRGQVQLSGEIIKEMEDEKTRPGTIPLSAKLGFTIWMVFWVSVVLWAYGPNNFLWLCNLAQFLILYSVWTGNRLILSSQAGVVFIVGLGWGLDYGVGLAVSGSVTGLTAYMFDPEIPLLARATSLYHVLLVPFVLWMCYRVGYDRRGWVLQCLIGTGALFASWLLLDPDLNVNWVTHPVGMEQAPLPQPLYIGMLSIVYPLILYLPGHGLMLAVLSFFKTKRPAA